MLNEQLQSPPAPQGGRRFTLRSLTAVAASIGGAWVAFVAMVASLNTITSSPEAFRNGEVIEFANHYFDTAVGEPGRARAELTTRGFQDLRQTQEPGYTEHWASISDVDLLSVGPAEVGNNWFDMHYEIIYRSGLREDIRSRWHMTCADLFRTYAPYYECARDDLRLDDLARVD
ncbi:hypothetical protein [Blastococcus montanus]|uniref:hypothetical protein n=1 Tax=Blastococcus montanus TaxID=3144973 RepID=UPI00320A6FF9